MPKEILFFRLLEGQIKRFQTLTKALGILNATARVAPDLLKAMVILSDTTVRRSAVDPNDLKPYWESDIRPYFSR